jgi:hypothetical protein
MSGKQSETHSGVSITGTVGNVGGSIVGRDQTNVTTTTTTTSEVSSVTIHNEALKPIASAIDAAQSGNKAEAMEKLSEIDKEVSKKDKADDSVIGNLLGELVKLVPSATAAVVSAFATPVLGAVAGQFTKFVIKQIQ